MWSSCFVLCSLPANSLLRSLCYYVVFGHRFPLEFICSGTLASFRSTPTDGDLSATLTPFRRPRRWPRLLLTGIYSPHTLTPAPSRPFGVRLLTGIYPRPSHPHALSAATQVATPTPDGDLLTPVISPDPLLCFTSSLGSVPFRFRSACCCSSCCHFLRPQDFCTQQKFDQGTRRGHWREVASRSLRMVS